MCAALETKGLCIGQSRDWKKATEIFEEVHRLAEHPLKGVTSLGCAYAKLGETEKALECIRKIEQRQIEEPGVVLDADLAMIRWFPGEKDKAFHNLFQCAEKRMGPVGIMIENVLFEGMPDDPRYRLLKVKMNPVEQYIICFFPKVRK